MDIIILYLRSTTKRTNLVSKTGTLEVTHNNILRQLVDGHRRHMTFILHTY